MVSLPPEGMTWDCTRAVKAGSAQSGLLQASVMPGTVPLWQPQGHNDKRPSTMLPGGRAVGSNISLQLSLQRPDSQAERPVVFVLRTPKVTVFFVCF